MDKLNFEELEDPRKLAVALGCEMVELATAIHRMSPISGETIQRLERCLLIAGLASGTIFKLTKEEASPNMKENRP